MDLIKEFPWTAIVGVLIMIFTVIVKYVFDRHVMPYLESKGLVEACYVAVNAAEAMYGRYKGEEKLKYALKLLSDEGWNIDSEAVIANINAAWQELNLKQIDAGIKHTE